MDLMGYHRFNMPGLHWVMPFGPSVGSWLPWRVDPEMFWHPNLHVKLFLIRCIDKCHSGVSMLIVMSRWAMNDHVPIKMTSKLNNKMRVENQTAVATCVFCSVLLADPLVDVMTIFWMSCGGINVRVSGIIQHFPFWILDALPEILLAPETLQGWKMSFPLSTTTQIVYLGIHPPWNQTYPLPSHLFQDDFPLPGPMVR